MFFLTLLAIVFVAGASSLDGPNKTDWEAGKANEAAAADAKAARDKKLGAVNKAVELLEKLQKQIIQEGEDEATTYNKFSCFCKDTTVEKMASIKEGEDETGVLTGAITKLSGDRDTLQGQIKTWNRNTAAKKKSNKLEKETREKEKAVYEADNKDLSAAIEALEGAVEQLKSSAKNAADATSLAQIGVSGSVAETLRNAATWADVLGVGSQASRSTFAAFLQDAPANEVQMEDYKFKSNSITSMLEDDLLPKFRAKKDEIDKAEVAAAAAQKMKDQAAIAYVKENERQVANTEKKSDDATADVEATMQRLTTVQAALTDDKAYVNKLNTMCRDKAKTWDQRNKARAAEITTLVQATDIIKGAVTEKTSAATIRFAQTGVTVSYAQSVAADVDSMANIEAVAEEMEAPSFLQMGSSGSALAAAKRQLRGRGSEQPADDVDSGAGGMVADLLRTSGTRLKSSLLVSLASQVTHDPLAKVKQLIQELIERLMKEAADESNQKAWCDKATDEATVTRDNAAEAMTDLNGNMAELEATRDQLAEEIAELAKQIPRIEAGQQKATTQRGIEKAQANATIIEAEQGLSALNMCIDLLDQFYKTIAKEKVDLSLEQGPEEDIPDAGFKTGAAYTGAQAESGGILGMLDVMKSDFVRTIKETTAEEAKAQQDYEEFINEGDMSIAEKTEAKTQMEDQKKDAVDKLEEDEKALKQKTDVVIGALKELQDLKPTCVDTGMSYEERVARREHEIESLNKASCILEKYAEFGADGVAEQC